MTMNVVDFTERRREQLHAEMGNLFEKFVVAAQIKLGPQEANALVNKVYADILKATLSPLVDRVDLTTVRLCYTYPDQRNYKTPGQVAIIPLSIRMDDYAADPCGASYKCCQEEGLEHRVMHLRDSIKRMIDYGIDPGEIDRHVMALDEYQYL
jgi:hypothetical protein